MGFVQHRSEIIISIEKQEYILVAGFPSMIDTRRERSQNMDTPEIVKRIAVHWNNTEIFYHTGIMCPGLSSVLPFRKGGRFARPRSSQEMCVLPSGAIR